jgi:hypothetical protein
MKDNGKIILEKDKEWKYFQIRINILEIIKMESHMVKVFISG